MYYCLVLLALLTSGHPWQAQSFPCGPSLEIRSQIEKAGVDAAGPGAIDKVLPPLAALRNRYPNDLFVHEAYQNAVQKHGIEGYLQALTDEYQALEVTHRDDPVYHYLFLRSIVGRNTRAAAIGLEEMAAQNPNFSPAIRTLAEIYDSGVFRDAEKEKSFKEKLAGLCPASPSLRKLDAVLDKSPLLGQAERLLAENGDPERAISMVTQAVVDDEWRNQLIRPHDLYSVEYKRQATRELQMEYLRAWAIQVRCQRKAGHPEKAAELVGRIESGAAGMLKRRDPAYWDALAILAGLYLEGKQVDQAKGTIERMQQLLVDHPDPDRASALDRLRQSLAGSAGPSR
ncbi:MAG TPA: hypothetical protein VLZ81_09250 [Blastocatellia bacterium]|nr:hypothetical protein [Blastocatellia bacterium]